MNPPEALTAAQVIRKECRFCIGAAQENRTTTVCKLHPDVFKCRSSVKRIKAHCQDCAVRDLSGSVYQAVRDCAGILLRDNGNGKICWLHSYRLGKNPSRPKRPPTLSQFPKRLTDPADFQVVESTIVLPVIPKDNP